MIDTENKGARLLDMYERLSHGEVISKKNWRKFMVSRSRLSSETSMNSVPIWQRNHSKGTVEPSSTALPRKDTD